MLNVHLKHPLEPELLERLRTRLDTRVHLTGGSNPPASDCAILVDGLPTEGDLQASCCLRAVIVPWVGAPLETIALLRRHPALSLHNLPYNAAPTAETALALLLAAAKRTVLHDRTFRRHIWSAEPAGEPGSVLLEGGTAVVLGYGRVGRRIAAGCRGLGLRVQPVGRAARACEEGSVHAAAALPELLPEATALLICVPHTTETEGMIGAAELALLPRHAVLVNVARGPIVDEAALYAALEQRRLFGAGLDVWYRYPSERQRALRIPVPPAHFPFHELDRVVMSPHRAGWSDETETARVDTLAEMLNGAAAGRELPHRIDPERGY